MLQVINEDIHFPLEVIKVVDDDKSKHNKLLTNKSIISRDQIKSIQHDGILVSSFKHHKTINSKLKLMNYNKKKIINFFDLKI